MDHAVLRDDMVDSLEHDSKAVVRTARVAEALRTVPRHEFVAEGHRAYLDRPFEQDGSRVLAPSTVARFMEALAPEEGDELLLVGAGVGYTAAVAAELVGARHVHAVDIARRLVHEARGNLATAGYADVLVDCQDGAEGLPTYAPFDRVLVEASLTDPPRRLREQLADDGRLVMAQGGVDQTLVAIEDDEVVADHGPVTLAPLLVDGEQTGAIERNRTAREDRERAERANRTRPGWERNWIDWDGH